MFTSGLLRDFWQWSDSEGDDAAKPDRLQRLRGVVDRATAEMNEQLAQFGRASPRSWLRFTAPCRANLRSPIYQRIAQTWGRPKGAAARSFSFSSKPPDVIQTGYGLGALPDDLFRHPTTSSRRFLKKDDYNGLAGVIA